MVARETFQVVLVYIAVTLTYFFKLVTIAPFPPLPGFNLVVVQPPYTLAMAVLKGAAIVAAATNVALFGWLLVRLYEESRRDSGAQP